MALGPGAFSPHLGAITVFTLVEKKKKTAVSRESEFILNVLKPVNGKAPIKKTEKLCDQEKQRGEVKLLFGPCVDNSMFCPLICKSISLRALVSPLHLPSFDFITPPVSLPLFGLCLPYFFLFSPLSIFFPFFSFFFSVEVSSTSVRQSASL